MHKKLFIVLNFIFLAFLAVSCNPENFLGEDDNSNTEKVSKTELASDYVWDDSNVKTISFNNKSITTNSSDVTISNDTAIITSGGYYSVSGNLTDGQLQINAPKSLVKLELNNVSIESSTTSPFYIKSGTKVILFLKSETTNTINDANTYANPDGPRAAIASEAYIGITGEGTLNVTGNYNDGISSDDPIVIKSGTVNVSAMDDGIRSKDYIVVHDGNITSSGVTGHALKADSTKSVGKGYIKIDGGNFTLSSALGDGIHTYKRTIIEGGTFNITAEESQALRSDSSVVISGGTITTSSNTKTGIKCPYITISGGTTTLNTAKVAIETTFDNSPTVADSSLLLITGGNLYVNSLSNSLTSDGNITITGGTTVVQGPSSTSKMMVKCLGEFTISNGVFIGCGSYNTTSMSGFSASSTQSCIKVNSSAISTNLFNIQDASGNSLVTFKPTRSAYFIVFSSPAIKSGTSYNAYTGGSYTGGANSNGYYTDGTYYLGALKYTFTIENILTNITF